MNTALAAGVAVTTAGLAGYVAGLSMVYPGRAFSLTLLMFGASLALVGRAGAAETA